MSYGPFERETLLDLTVNVIPIGILLFFAVLMLIANQWGWDPFALALSVGLMLVPVLCLGLLTYVAGQVIQRDENRQSDTS